MKDEGLMQMFLDSYYPDGASPNVIADYKKRSWSCTPFECDSVVGPAGWVICVNGSPPKGYLVIFVQGPPWSVAYSLYGQKAKRISKDEEAMAVQRFYESQLAGKTEKFVIE